MRLEVTRTDKQHMVWFGGARAITATGEAQVYVVEVPVAPSPLLPARPIRQPAFDGHVASLPSLEDLVARWRAGSPGFDDALAAAREAQYRGMLAEVEAGSMSRVRAERLRLRWTQAQLADRAGLQQANVSRLERPSARPSIATAKRLAEALGIADYRELLPR